MAKLILKINNEVIDHIELKQGDMKIGRMPGSDIHIDNLAVSGDHANIFTVGEDSFIQDLNSTNGTLVNNKQITKHHLRTGDTISIGQFSLVYVGTATERISENFAKTVIINPEMSQEPDSSTPSNDVSNNRGKKLQGVLYILSGKKSGKRIELTKTITNLGKIGKRGGSITRTPSGFVLSVSGADELPKLNGRLVTSDGVKLKNGDIIDVSGTRLQFYLK